jgi:hypothetical protein
LAPIADRYAAISATSEAATSSRIRASGSLGAAVVACALGGPGSDVSEVHPARPTAAALSTRNVRLSTRGILASRPDIAAHAHR